MLEKKIRIASSHAVGSSHQIFERANDTMKRQLHRGKAAEHDDPGDGQTGQHQPTVVTLEARQLSPNVMANNVTAKPVVRRSTRVRKCMRPRFKRESPARCLPGVALPPQRNSDDRPRDAWPGQMRRDSTSAGQPKAAAHR